MIDPDNFRRDREWPCCQPDCKLTFPTSEQMQLHFKLDHTEEEKDAAWAKVPAFFESRRQVFGLVAVMDHGRLASLQAEGAGLISRAPVGEK